MEPQYDKHEQWNYGRNAKVLRNKTTCGQSNGEAITLQTRRQKSVSL